MSLCEIAVLSLVQGITEFLPVSSSAHLIVAREIFAELGLVSGDMTPAEELAFDIALHIGSLGAVVIYFRSEMVMFVRGLVDLRLPTRGDVEVSLLRPEGMALSHHKRTSRNSSF